MVAARIVGIIILRSLGAHPGETDRDYRQGAGPDSSLSGCLGRGFRRSHFLEADLLYALARRKSGWDDASDFRLGSKCDLVSRQSNVRFYTNSDYLSRAAALRIGLTRKSPS